jgi:hypothetical protein
MCSSCRSKGRDRTARNKKSKNPQPVSTRAFRHARAVVDAALAYVVAMRRGTRRQVAEANRSLLEAVDLYKLQFPEARARCHKRDSVFHVTATATAVKPKTWLTASSSASSARTTSTAPFTQRMKREQKLGDTPSKQEKSAMKTTATVAVRECGVQGCGKHLIASNRSGFCTKHFYQSKKSTSAPKVPKSPAKRTTGVTRIVEKVPEERASLSLTRAQLVALFNSWPIERQVAAVQAVFVQELSLA